MKNSFNCALAEWSINRLLAIRILLILKQTILSLDCPDLALFIK